MYNNKPYMPQTIDIEKAIIASIIRESDLMDLVLSSGVTEESFYEPKYKLMFTTSMELIKSGIRVDMLTLSARLPDLLMDIADMTTAINSTAFIADWIMILKKAQVARNIKLISQTSINNITENAIENIDKSISDLSIAILSANRLLSGIKIKSTGEIALDYFENMKTPKEVMPYFEIGTEAYGIIKHCKREMFVICGNTGTGKTALTANMVIEAILSGHNVAYYCDESDSESIFERIISAKTGISHYIIRYSPQSLKATQERWNTYSNGMKFMSDNKDNIYIRGVETGILTPDAIASDVRNIITEHGKLDIVVIDFIQALQVPEYMSKKEKHLQITYCVEKLHKLFIECNCAGIVLSQLNREGSKQNVMPGLEHLKDSSVIAQLAHTVSFLHRDQKEGNEPIKFYSRKTRNQPPFYLELDFDGAKYTSKKRFNDDDIPQKQTNNKYKGYNSK